MRYAPGAVHSLAPRTTQAIRTLIRRFAQKAKQRVAPLLQEGEGKHRQSLESQPRHLKMPSGTSTLNAIAPRAIA
jgi:hypothetical protein